MTRLLSVGHAALDHIYRVTNIPVEAEKVAATAYVECGGGMAANASVAATRLGAESHYWGRLGNDAVGARILQQLADEGVDVSAVRRMDDRTSPTAAIMVDHRGERLVCSYNDPLVDNDPVWLPLARVASFDIVLADVRWPEGSAAVMNAAHAAGVLSVFDGDTGSTSAIESLCGLADYSIFSERGLIGASGTSDIGRGLSYMQEHARGMVGVTLGGDGFLWLDGGTERRRAAPRIDAVDTLGAGDVFHAAFAIAIVEGHDIARAAEFANVAAALKCTRFGGRDGAPTRNEVDAFMAAGPYTSSRLA